MSVDGVKTRVGSLDLISNSGKSLLEMAYSGELLPIYTFKRYTDSIYGIVKFKRNPIPYLKPKEEQTENDNKLDNNFSRARSMVKQYGLCNPWDYFLTITLDARKYNRYDLEAFKSDFSQFVRDERKRHKRLYGDDVERLSVLIVPENHKDGAWHMHGFVYGLPHQEISEFIPGIHPQKLIDKGFLNWQAYANKFGFCSLGKIRDQYSAVLYACKYIDKGVEALSAMKGQHLYFHSRPLETAMTVSHSYTHHPDLDKYLDWHGQFCETGMVTEKDWTFPLQYAEDIEMIRVVQYEGLSENPDFDAGEINPFEGELISIEYYEELGLGLMAPDRGVDGP